MATFHGAARRTAKMRRPIWLALAMVAAIAGGVTFAGWKLGWFVKSNQTECARLTSLKNASLGRLENIMTFKDYGMIVGMLEEIEKLLPNDPFAPRNLAVCRLIQLTSEDLPTKEAAGDIGEVFESLQAAITRLKDLEPESAAAYYLEGMMLDTQIAKGFAADKIAARGQALKAFEMAATLDPGDPAPLFRQYELLTNSTVSVVELDEPLPPDIMALLERMQAIDPTNLYLLLEIAGKWAIAKDPRFEKAVEELLAVLARLPRVSKSIMSVLGQEGELADFLGKLIESSKAGDWNAPIDNLQVINGLIRPIVFTQHDRRRLDPSPLEYAHLDFQTECRRVESNPNEIQVVFSPISGGPLDDLQDVLDLQWADVNLDRRLDVVALRKGSLEAYARVDKAPHWKLLARIDVPEGFDRLTLVDLDCDTLQQRESGDESSQADASDLGGNENEVLRKRDADQHGDKPSLCTDVDSDCIIYGAGGVMLFRNDPDGPGDERQLVPIPQLKKFTDLRDVQALCAADLLHDGDLDLAIATPQGVTIWSNLGSGTYESRKGQMEFTELSGDELVLKSVGGADALVPVDLDFDVDLDVVVTGVSGQPVGMIENLRHGQFRWTPFKLAAGIKISALDAAPVDPNRDQIWDLIFAGPHGVQQLDRTGTLPQKVRFAGVQTLVENPVNGVTHFDFDNDGQRDFVAWGENGLQLMKRSVDGKFVELTDALPSDLGVVRVCRAFDQDSDGDIDLAVVANGQVRLIENDGGNQNHWIDIWTRAGFADQKRQFRINAHGLGSLIEVAAADHYQSQIVSREVTHFGLGSRKRADLVRSVYTNGIPQAIVNPATVQDFCEEQRLGGSCPYLYAWNGDRFEFFSDCLWAAPIGLQVDEGKYAGSRAWEYLSIPGERLQERNGRYSLQMTEELFEICYLDEMRLIAVDHPADVQIFSNDKVGPPEIVQHKIHAVSKPREFVSARDGHGRNVSAQLRSRDEDYVKAFDVRYTQGVAEEHFIELDLGPLADPAQITMFLTGWIYPTSTSLNIGIGENPDIDAPRPPALWTPDANGEWKLAIPNMGFPGGKTKTIAVDLSNVFASADRRVRIVTSMEIYWDHAFFTTDEPPVELRQTVLELAKANLHYRGFSQRVPGKNHGPEWYDYQNVSADAAWPPLEGRFTRYGDVAELLSGTDDKLAIFGAGDELTVEFSAPLDPLPAGWKRDFLLYNVGWDKDADLNTAYGQSVEPLPFQAMQSYPYRLGESYPDSGELRSYHERFQTREQPPAVFWRQLLRRSQGQ